MNLLELAEYEPREVCLSLEEAFYLSQLKFEVVPHGEIEGQPSFLVNPKQFVGHFCFPFESQRIVTVSPKIDSAGVFRLLAYVYDIKGKEWFRHETVNYAKQKLLFEPLARLFNSLVQERGRRGLLKDYIRSEDNMRVFKGSLGFSEHIQLNAGRPDRIYCKFYENVIDIYDNQLVKTALLAISRQRWSAATEQLTLCNLQLFGEVSTLQGRKPTLSHYHRLNDDYRFLHVLSLLFLNGLSLDEKVGDLPFNGFLLDMNKLFELFVEKAFVTVAAQTRSFAARPQKKRALSPGVSWARIEPDVTIEDRAGFPVAVADAKYKADSGQPSNADLYQVITYAATLPCRSAFLIYPETETPPGALPVLNTDIVVNVRTVDLKSENCVENMQTLVRESLAETGHLANRQVS